MRKVACGEEFLRIFCCARQTSRCLFGAKSASIHVFSLEGNADVGLEVCKRQYILLRRPCDFIPTSPIVAGVPATDILFCTLHPSMLSFAYVEPD